MEPQVARELGMEASRPRPRPAGRAPGRRRASASTSTASPTRSIDRRADEHAGERRRRRARRRRAAPRTIALAAVAVAPHRDVEQRRAAAGRARPSTHLAREHDQPGARAERRAGRRASRVGERRRAARTSRAACRSWSTRRRAGRARRRRARCSGAAHLDGLGAERVEHLTMLAERSLQREHADLHLEASGGIGDRSPAAVGELHVERVDLLAAASPRRARATPWRRSSASAKCVVASTIALRHASRVVALEDAAADEHRLRAELHHERGVGRGGDAARAEQRDRELAALGDLLHEVDRRAQLLGPAVELLGPSATVSLRMSPRIERRWRTASTMLPVPASPFERIMHAPSEMRRSASPRLVAPHTNGTVNAHLSTWYASSAGVSTSDSSM